MGPTLNCADGAAQDLCRLVLRQSLVESKYEARPLPRWQSEDRSPDDVSIVVHRHGIDHPRGTKVCKAPLKREPSQPVPPAIDNHPPEVRPELVSGHLVELVTHTDERVLDEILCDLPAPA